MTPTRRAQSPGLATLIGLAFAVLAAIPASARGQAAAVSGQPRAWEVWGGLSLGAPHTSGTLMPDTAILTLQSGSFENQSRSGSQRQTVTIGNSGTATGFEGGLNHFFSRSVGVQALVAYDSRALGGDGSAYNWQVFSLAGSLPATEITGTLRQWTVAGNLVGRRAFGGRVTGAVSGGLAFFATRGHIQPVATTVGALSYVHGPVAPSESAENYDLTVNLDALGIGFNAGGGFDIALGPKVGLTIDARYFRSAEVQPDLAVSQVLSSTVSPPRSIDTLQEALGVPALTLTTGRIRFFVGVRVGL